MSTRIQKRNQLKRKKKSLALKTVLTLMAALVLFAFATSAIAAPSPGHAGKDQSPGQSQGQGQGAGQSQGHEGTQGQGQGQGQIGGPGQGQGGNQGQGQGQGQGKGPGQGQGQNEAQGPGKGQNADKYKGKGKGGAPGKSDKETCSYTVTFDANGGALNSAAQVKVKDGAPVAKPDNDPARSGYVFLGWYTTAHFGGSQYDFEAPVTSDVTLYARWIKLVTVTFNANKGTFSDGVTTSQKSQVTLGSKVSKVEAPVRAGYKFAGWSLTPSGSVPYDFRLPVLVNFTLYAKWVKCSERPVDTYTVTFDSRGGSEVDPYTDVVSGDTIDKPANPVKAGFVFAGWYTESDDEWDFDNDVVESDLTLHAVWTPVKDEGGKTKTEVKPLPAPKPLSSLPKAGDSINVGSGIVALFAAAGLLTVVLIRRNRKARAES